MPVTPSSDDIHTPPLHTPPSGGNLKRTHPLRVSFLHSNHGPSAGTSSQDTAQTNDSNFTRGHVQRQTTPNIVGHINSRQIVRTRSQSHQHLGLIGGNGRIQHYCPFHGPVKPHVHDLALIHSSSQLELVDEESHEESTSSTSSSLSTTGPSAGSDGGESKDRSENSVEVTIESKRSKLEISHTRLEKSQRKGCWQWKPLHHAMLMSCYALLLLLAVLVGVVVSQSHRLSSRRRQPVQGGAVQIRLRPDAGPQGPPPRIGGRAGGARRRRPQSAVPVPPPPPPPTTTTTTTTTTEFPLYDYEYDYEYFDSHASSLPVAPPPPAPTTTFKPLPPPTTRPAQVVRQQTVGRQQTIGRQQNVGRPVDRQTFRPASSPPRRQGVSLANIDQDFTLNTDPEIRGRKEPTVQIARAWSHQNPDGTFTWGYINTDGSYKNETKGTDCVVRGSYGYIDEATGQEIDVPYATGNPCNPEAPVLEYVDYDVQGFLANVRSGSAAQEPAPAQRQPQQQFDSSSSLRSRKF